MFKLQAFTAGINAAIKPTNSVTKNKAPSFCQRKMEETRQSVVETVSSDLIKDIFESAGFGEKKESQEQPPTEDKNPLPPVSEKIEEPAKTEIPVQQLEIKTSDYKGCK